MTMLLYSVVLCAEEIRLLSGTAFLRAYLLRIRCQGLVGIVRKWQAHWSLWSFSTVIWNILRSLHRFTADLRPMCMQVFMPAPALTLKHWIQ